MPPKGRSVAKKDTEEPAVVRLPSNYVLPPLPKSYRGLVDGITATSDAVEHNEAEVAEAKAEILALTGRLSAANEEATELTESECALEARLQRRREEASELWTSHEAPLREREQAVWDEEAAVEELAQRTETTEMYAAKLRVECDHHEGHGTHYFNKIGELRTVHQNYSSHMERASERARSCALQHDRGESKFEAAQRNSVMQHRRRHAYVAEVRSEQGVLQTLRQELTELERHCRSSATGWWASQRNTCEVMASETKQLEMELKQSEAALDGHSHEAAAWREQAFRSESGLRTLHGEDVAGGFRELKKRCELYVQSGNNAASSVHPQGQQQNAAIHSAAAAGSVTKVRLPPPLRVPTPTGGYAAA